MFLKNIDDNNLISNYYSDIHFQVRSTATLLFLCKLVIINIGIAIYTTYVYIFHGVRVSPTALLSSCNQHLSPLPLTLLPLTLNKNNVYKNVHEIHNFPSEIFLMTLFPGLKLTCLSKIYSINISSH